MNELNLEEKEKSTKLLDSNIKHDLTHGYSQN